MMFTDKKGKKEKEKKKGEPQKPVNSEEVCEEEVYTVRGEQKHHISDGIWSLTGMGQGKSFILALQEYFYSKHNPFEQIQTCFPIFIQSGIVRIPQKSSFVFRHHSYLKSMSHTIFRQFTSLQWTSLFFYFFIFFNFLFFYFFSMCVFHVYFCWCFFYNLVFSVYSYIVSDCLVTDF